MFPLIFEIWRFAARAVPRRAPERRTGVHRRHVHVLPRCAVGYIVFPFTFRFLEVPAEHVDRQPDLDLPPWEFLMLIFVMGIALRTLPLLAWLLSKIGLVTKVLLPAIPQSTPWSSCGALSAPHHPLGRPVHADGSYCPQNLPALMSSSHQIFEGPTPTSIQPETGFPPWTRFFSSRERPDRPPGKMQEQALRLLPGLHYLAAPLDRLRLGAKCKQACVCSRLALSFCIQRA